MLDLDKFKLDERLEKDTFFVKDLKLSRLLIMNDSRYPRLILVPRVFFNKEPITELFELEDEQLLELQREVKIYSEFLKQEFQATKINVASLGNVVKQLHIHIVARYENDETWPAPVWGKGKASYYNDAELAEFSQKLQKN